MTTPIDAQWLLRTLEDAAQTLATALERIDSDPRRARGVLEHEIPELYAKLNYAVNTAQSGPVDLNNCDHNRLIAWPTGPAFDVFTQEEAMIEIEPDEHWVELVD